VRSFYLKNVKTGETRTVTQFHFLSWPEGGIPHSTKALLEFRRYVFLFQVPIAGLLKICRQVQKRFFKKNSAKTDF
jgi:hypothetical protein